MEPLIRRLLLALLLCLPLPSWSQDRVAFNRRVAATGQDFTADASCIGAYTFATVGTWLDDECDSGTANNLTDAFNVAFTTTDCDPGGNGGCADFPESTELTAADSSDWIQSSLSVFLRFKDDQVKTYRLVSHEDEDCAGCPDGWEMLMFSSAGGIQIEVNIDGAADTLDAVIPAVDINKWRTVAFSWDGADTDEIRLYYNGCIQNATPQTATTLTDPSETNAGSPNDVHLGTQEDGFGDFDGRFDELLVMSRTLSDAEHLGAHNRGIEGSHDDRGASCS